MVSSLARLLPMGDRAILLEVESLEQVLALHAALAASRPPGVVDLVPAARTVLVHVDPRVLSLAAARAWIERLGELTDAAPRADYGPRVELAAVYDGPDLADTARLLGLSPEALVAQHTAAEWTVAFTGFAPGFGYLVSPEWTHDVPRLDSPRTRVPAGAIGLAAGFTGAYPRETPGGWRLIGTTPERLFDPDAASPALLAPGARVRFVARRATLALSPALVTEPTRSAAHDAVSSRGSDGFDDPRSAATRRVGSRGSDELDDPRSAATRRAGFRVIEPGLLSTIQDLGRPGAASLGVSRSGALDRAALRTANRLVGNAEDDAGVEVTMGGFRAVAEADLWFAVTGGWGAVRLDRVEIDPYEAHAWPRGAELHVDWFAHGARAYLAVRGGLDAPTALGSRATDLLAGLGPEPLRAGDRIDLAGAASVPVPAPSIAPWGAPHDDDLDLPLAPGPRADWFAASALRDLYEAVWTVTNDADRVGVRLDGPALERVRDRELPSEGMFPGALQVPPSGRPTILLADGPVTGGYPVIAVATDAALDAIAQARPGTRIRFRHSRAS